MKLTVVDGICNISVSELAFFSRTKNAGGLRMLRFAKKQGREYLSEAGEISLEDGDIRVTSPYEGLTARGGTPAVEKVRFVSRVTSKTSPYGDPKFLCEAVLSAYVVCKNYNASNVRLTVTMFCDRDGSSLSFETTLEEETLLRMYSGVMSRAMPFIEIEKERKTEGKKLLSKMPFPYAGIREGQRDFINDTFHAAKTGSRLMVCAPTGIGKTISALYPALRAIGSGYVDRVFYLTAKTVTGKAAADAVAEMAKEVPTLRAVFVSAKDRVCLMEGGAKSGCAFKCRMTAPLHGATYEARRDAAMLSLLRRKNIIYADDIRNAAEKYLICPYELSLDISEYCEVIICDYNYVFDPHVRFRRYFGVENEKNLILVDEAHNLPDRAREMYSATITASPFLKLYSEKTEFLAMYPEIKKAVAEVIKTFREVAILCKEEETSSGGEVGGWYLSSEILPAPGKALSAFAAAVKKASKEIEIEDTVILRAYEDAVKYVTAENDGVANSVFFAETSGTRLKISIRCLDPSDKLSEMTAATCCAVFFSATLTPMEYFADILGCRDAVKLELDSPYDPDNLLVVGVNSVSTRYSSRRQTAPEIAELIFSVIEAKEGNYIAYFPSYDFMIQVYREFAQLAGGIKIVLQKRSMSLTERDKFLRQFREGRGDPLIGFCVLGGAFAEGVDLAGEKLIGTIIVGTGLPKISSELNLLKEYFDSTRENGYDYAYTYPSMIKVQQAAGRVIRSENDRGVVVLMDDRYTEPPILKLLPKHWKKIKFVSDPFTLSSALERFWETPPYEYSHNSSHKKSPETRINKGNF